MLRTRPSINRLFDLTVRVWRPAASRDGLGAEQRSYVPQPQTRGAAMNRSVAPMSRTGSGSGLAPVGRRRFYMEADADIQPRDILEIIAGPEAGQRWEVDEPPTKPKNHHSQVDTITWNGILPPVEES